MEGVVISGIDLAVVGAYFVVVLALGIWIGMKTTTGDDLFLGGRTLTWGFIGLSLFASNISSTTLIGLSGAAYSSGIAVSNYEWLAGVPLILAAAVFIPLYIKARITTIPEFLELRFDRRLRSYFSVITILLSIIVDTAGGLYAGAIVLKVFFPGLVIWQTTLVLAVVAGLYTAFGGLKAVVYTDAIQAVILIVGTALLTLILFSELDFSWSRVVDAMPEGRLSVIRPLNDPMLPWLGTLVGVPILGFWYWVTNQYITQRVLGAKDVLHAQWGAMVAGILKLVPLFIMVLPGAMAVVLFPVATNPALKNPDMVFPIMVTQALPAGLVGLVMAGLISAIMSSVDSTLNSASTLVVVDFVQTRKTDLTPKQVGRYGRVTTVVLMAVAALWAPAIASFGGLFMYLQQAFSILVPPIATIFLVGVFWKRGNATGAFWTMVLGHLLGVGLFVLGQTGHWNVHFTINVGLMTAVSSAIFVVISLMSSPPPADCIERATWRPGLAAPDRELRWYQTLKFQSAVLLAGMGMILVMFW